MMARRRKRKVARDIESAQVELLPDTESSAPPEGVDEPDVDAPSPPERVAGDRWAKAVGRMEPIGTSEPEDAQEETRQTTVTLGPATPGPAATPGGPTATEDTLVPSRDHAAAGVRPAGEPLERAKELVKKGRVYEAIDLYLGILTVNPSNLKARNNLGVLFDELKQYETALEHFAAAERLSPENVGVLTNFASTLTSLTRYDEADALLRRAQKLDADDVQVRLAVGVLLFRRGLYAQAETELRWVCARDRDNGRAFYYRGEALNLLSRFDEASQVLKRATVLLPNDPKAFYTLGHLYDRRYLPEEAAEMYRRARQLQNR